MPMKTAVVTGAGGFIGKHVAAAMREAGWAVRGFSRSSLDPNLLSLNYGDPTSTTRALEGAAVILHVAGLAHVNSSSMDDPEARYRESNVDVAVSVAEAGVRAGAGKFILLSSAGVLGRSSPSEGFQDTSAADPYDAYTWSKLEAEQQVSRVAAGKMDLIIIRPPMVYGPGAPGSYRRLCGWIDRGLPMPFSSIVARRSFVGIRNLCDLLLTISDSDKSVPHDQSTMLVADSEPMTVADFARQIAAVRGKRALLLPTPARLLEMALRIARLQEEYRRLALPFELIPTRTSEIFNWRPSHATIEELRWAFGR
jgi:nucleoside-diphosphate-sugar epimerase